MEQTSLEANIATLYRVFLGREPESPQQVQAWIEQDDFRGILTKLMTSFESSVRPHVKLASYTSTFDPVELMQRYEDPTRQPRAGHIVNFLGVAFDPSFVQGVAGIPGTVERLPIPGNWHADMAEFAAALRAVDLAKGSFTVLELGCGWGCWMNQTGVAARRRELPVHAIGIEGDAGHIEFAKVTLATNGFSPDEYTLMTGVAAAVDGSAFFPRQDFAGASWGLSPLLVGAKDKPPSDLDRYHRLPAVSIATAIGARDRIDLMHVDIQGGEAEVIPRSQPILDKKVAYMVIGTHSREIDGMLVGHLTRAGWVLEMERPTIFSLRPGGPLTEIDGVQGWRNPRLLPL